MNDTATRTMVLSAGSTGDIAPFAALAARLATRRPTVTLATDDAFEAFAPGRAVEFAAIRADFQSLLSTPGRRAQGRAQRAAVRSRGGAGTVRPSDPAAHGRHRSEWLLATRELVGNALDQGASLGVTGRDAERTTAPDSAFGASWTSN